MPLREEARYLLACSCIYQSDLFLWTGTIFDSLRESGNLPDKIASLKQEVKYSKVNPLSFQVLIGISPAVALFEGSPSITLFTV